MSEINTNLPTEESVLQSIEELGGIPAVEVSMEVSGMTAYPTDKTLSIADMPADAKATGDLIDALQGTAGSQAADIAEIQAWTGDDIPLEAPSEEQTEEIPTIAEAVNANATAIAALQARTGATIPLNAEESAPTIAEAIADVVIQGYPVGSIYMSTSSTAPTFGGTWEEIAITATWAQLKDGTRNYAPIPLGGQGGTVHFWRRTA